MVNVEKDKKIFSFYNTCRQETKGMEVIIYPWNMNAMYSGLSVKISYYLISPSKKEGLLFTVLVFDFPLERHVFSRKDILSKRMFLQRYG